MLQSDKYLKRLSTAALETLAIIAYKQPVTKGEMEHIRGVNCDYAVQKLLEKELITITGRREGSPGQPLEYVASRHFMDYFGMNSLDELPKLNDLFPQDVAEATTIKEAHPVEEDSVGEAELHMAVNENGEVIEIMDDAITEQQVNEDQVLENNETPEEDTGAPGNKIENGEVIEIMEDAVPVNNTIEVSDIREEDTDEPGNEIENDEGNGRTAVRLNDKTENGDENENVDEAPTDEITNGAENEHTEEAPGDKKGDKDGDEITDEALPDEIEIGEENVGEPLGSEIENRNENANLDEEPENEKGNGEENGNTEESLNDEIGDRDENENVDEAPGNEKASLDGNEKTDTEESA